MEESFDGASEEEAEAAAPAAGIVSRASDTGVEEVLGPHGGSIPGPHTVIRHTYSWHDVYLSAEPRYKACRFREVFRILIKLFLAICTRLTSEHPDLLQRIDGLGRPGHISNRKLLSSPRRIGMPASCRDRDDSACMSPESQRQAFRTFIGSMEETHGSRYLIRDTTHEELRQIILTTRARDFPIAAVA